MSAPPSNLDAEQAVLGALLFDNEVFHHLPDLAEEEFYDPVHGRIYGAIAATVRAGKLADGTTLRARFERDGGLSEIGGQAYILVLMEAAAKLRVHAVEYAKLIKDLALRRQIIAVCRQTAMSAMAADGTSASDLLDGAMHSLDVAAETSSPTAWRSMSAVMKESVTRAREGLLRGVSTGISALDDRLNGLRPETFVVVGGRVKMGKTLVGMSIARAVADQKPKPGAPNYGVAIFALEMDEDQTGLREASDLAFANRPRYSGVDQDPSYFAALKGELAEEQWRWLEEAADSRPDWNLEVDFTPALTPSQIESRSRRLFRKWRTKGITPFMIVIDHMGRVKPDKGNSSRAAERSDVIDDLDALKKKLGCCVLGLSQINRSGDSEERPNNTNLEWSDRIAANAQAVVLLYREEYYLLRKADRSFEEEDRLNAVRNRIELIVDIVRSGTAGTVMARVNLPTASLRDLDKPV